MVYEILYGIETQLKNAFGEKYRIGSERAEQDLQPPAILIMPGKTLTKQRLGRRRYVEQPFEITVIPESKNDVIQLYDDAEIMVDALELIEVGTSLIRGTGICWEVRASVLTFLVRYNIFFIQADDVTRMGDISENIYTT